MPKQKPEDFLRDLLIEVAKDPEDFKHPRKGGGTTRMSAYLSECSRDFNSFDLEQVAPEARIADVFVGRSFARILVFRGTDHSPYKTELIHDDETGWKLIAFDSICTTCLGVGLEPNDERLCELCRGSGWGMAFTPENQVN